MNDLPTFLWSDGQRATPKTLPSWVRFHTDLGLSRVILILNDTDPHDGAGAGEDWIDDHLIEASQALRDSGIWVGWMWWIYSKAARIERQLSDTDRLMRRFVPDGLQLDSEGHNGRSGEKRVGIWAKGVQELRGKHGHFELSITSVASFKAEARPQDAALIRLPEMTAVYDQSYLFHNPKSGHWSHGLPKSPLDAMPRLSERTWQPYLAKRHLAARYLGLAAHMQNIPGVDGLDGMRAGIAYAHEAYRDGRICGVGWWSRKHLTGKGAAGKRDLVRAAGGHGAAITLNAPEALPPNLGKAAAYNARAAVGLGWGGNLPQLALDWYMGFSAPVDSVQFAEAVLSYQLDAGLVGDGKLGPATWAYLYEQMTHRYDRKVA